MNCIATHDFLEIYNPIEVAKKEQRRYNLEKLHCLLPDTLYSIYFHFEIDNACLSLLHSH